VEESITGRELVMPQDAKMGDAMLSLKSVKEERNVFEILNPLLDAFKESKQVRRSILILRGLSEAGWMRYGEIRKLLGRIEGSSISDRALQDLLKPLIKHDFIYKVPGVEGEGKRTAYYIISEKGLRVAKAMDLPFPVISSQHTSDFPAPDPFTERLNALVDKKSKKLKK
jgi:DNA-binding HxlR family transcriptional regulator